jgi:RNA polymerase sigma factor (sigma-70 family)
MAMSRGQSAQAAPITLDRDDRSDEDLISDVRAGHDRAFGCLYKRYRRRIAAYAYGVVVDYERAEDITQDVFISALRSIRATDRPIAFKAWIYKIASNACIDHFRRGKQAQELSYDADDALRNGDDPRLIATAPTADAVIETKQQLNDLCGAFGGLSKNHHQILLLRELEGLSYREIGKRMRLTGAAVESTLFRARSRLYSEYHDLASGQRCHRIRTLIAATAEAALDVRDRDRIAQHASRCEPCRRHAFEQGDRSNGGSLVSHEPRNDAIPVANGDRRGGRYWARTSDLRLVEAALSQLS